MLTRREDQIRSVTKGMKWMLFVASILVFIVGIQLFIFTEQTDRYFAWTVNPPLTAASLGAAYWASFIMELSASRQETWARTRIAVPAVLLFTWLTLIATLLHLDRFHLGDQFNLTTQLATWAWIAVYALVPILMSILLVLQLRVPGKDTSRHQPLGRWFQAILSLHAVVMLGAGAALFLVPTATLSVWPWMLTPLTARAVGAWLLGLGLAAAQTTRENDCERVAIATNTYIVLGVFEFIALLRYPNNVAWDKPSAWLYVLFLASILAVGVFGGLKLQHLTRHSTAIPNTER
jgi:uncharacterized integral membrane protein